MRARVEKQIAKKQKEEKEENLREMAQRARADRAGIRAAGRIVCFTMNNHAILLTFLDKGDEQEAERDQIRQERHKERQRAAALQRAGGDKK